MSLWMKRHVWRMENDPAYVEKRRRYELISYRRRRLAAGFRDPHLIQAERTRMAFLELMAKRVRFLSKRPPLTAEELRRRRRIWQKKYHSTPGGRLKLWERRKARRKQRILKICKDGGDWKRFWHHRKNRLVSRRRQLARKGGIEFTVTAADLAWPAKCPVLGVKLNYTTLGKWFPESPSLDRIDLSKGYVPGNVAVISHRANTLKSNSSPEELEKILNYIKFAEFVTSMPVNEPKGFEDV